MPRGPFLLLPRALEGCRDEGVRRFTGCKEGDLTAGEVLAMEIPVPSFGHCRKEARVRQLHGRSPRSALPRGRRRCRDPTAPGLAPAAPSRGQGAPQGCSFGTIGQPLLGDFSCSCSNASGTADYRSSAIKNKYIRLSETNRCPRAGQNPHGKSNARAGHQTGVLCLARPDSLLPLPSWDGARHQRTWRAPWTMNLCTSG